MDWALAAPAMTRLDIPAGATFPASADRFWLPEDAYFVVMNGNVTFNSSSDAAIHEYGDVFYAIAGTKVGPLKNVGKKDVIVQVMTAADMQDLKTGDEPKENPSTASWLKTRSYLRSVCSVACAVHVLKLHSYIALIHYTSFILCFYTGPHHASGIETLRLIPTSASRTEASSTACEAPPVWKESGL
jgi:hypothetical protein